MALALSLTSYKIMISYRASLFFFFFYLPLEFIIAASLSSLCC